MLWDTPEERVRKDRAYRRQTAALLPVFWALILVAIAAVWVWAPGVPVAAQVLASACFALMASGISWIVWDLGHSRVWRA